MFCIYCITRLENAIMQVHGLWSRGVSRGVLHIINLMLWAQLRFFFVILFS
jgi:hypothetical protein